MKKGLIQVVNLPKIGKGRKPEALELTEKGIVEAESLGFKFQPAGRKGGLLHKFMTDLVRKEIQRHGCKVESEYQLGNGQAIDLVVNDKVAIEIETGYSDIKNNIEKLAQSKFERTLIVCADYNLKNRIEKEIQKFDQRKRPIVIEINELATIDFWS